MSVNEIRRAAAYNLSRMHELTQRLRDKSHEVSEAVPQKCLDGEELETECNALLDRLEEQIGLLERLLLNESVAEHVTSEITPSEI